MLTTILTIVIIILSIIIVSEFLPKKENGGFKKVNSYKELEKIYNRHTSSFGSTLKEIATLPISLMRIANRYMYTNIIDDIQTADIALGESTPSTAIKGSSSVGSVSDSKDYSTTNIQVENVDEADVTKTDGNYIYSLSDNKVVITDVSSIDEAKVVSKITMKSGAIPQELLLYGDKLVVIGKISSLGVVYVYNYNLTTDIEVFDITNKENPVSVKTLQINEPYYTCRLINNNVYVLSSGYLKKDSNNKIDINYVENSESKEIKYSNMYYMKDLYNVKQTIITGIDLNDLQKDVDIKSYFVGLDNAYVSENNIYIAVNAYNYENDKISAKWLFGLGGIIGFVNKLDNLDYKYERTTTIYKFAIDGTNIIYVAKTEDNGQTINQFSMDEYQGNLRVALYDNDGTRINIYDSKLNRIGQTENMAKGEKMYSSRFIQGRAYLVTYKNMDPLFVVNLNDPTNPKVLGELKIPGYSTYLHPYDENHIIGIGMQTKETINRRIDGTIYNAGAKIIGMKMALFDVTDVNNPKQISETIIGNSRTTSAILTNHKALLFSKEKNIIAIPVNNYETDFEISNSSDDISDIISLYVDKTTNYIAEGYEVYNLDLENGFVKKGTITHELGNSIYSYRTLTHLLRGMYIEDNLYTVSERMIKINKLDNLELLKEIKIDSSTKK